MGSRRELALAVGLVLLLALLATLAAPDADRAPSDPRLSTFRVSPQGARGLFLALDRLGVRTEPRLGAYVEGDSLRGALAVLAPIESPTPAELHALTHFVRGGGTLLYVARPDDATLDSLGLVLAPLPPDTARAGEPEPVVPTHHRLAVGTPEVSGVAWVFDDASPALDVPGASPLLVTGSADVAAVEYRLGAGRVVAWSDPAPFRNRAVRESGAAVLFARAAAEATAPGGTLRFDEFHHGFRGDGSAVAGTLRFLGRTAPGWALLQLAVAGAGLLFLLGRRFGAPHPPVPARRRSPLEHVDALAEAYRQAGARRTARRLLVAGLARRTGRGAPRDPAGEAELLRRLGATRPEPGDDLIALARDIDHLLPEPKPT